MTDHRDDPLAQAPMGKLAAHVIQELNCRQAVTPSGARRFVLDHLMRAICKRGAFDGAIALDILRGHRVSVDRVIEVYIPEAATQLGQMWMDDTVDFATVTIGALRLQSILTEATGRVFYQPNALLDLRSLVVVPEGEQHFLGASVAAAQLRRLGCDTHISFAENDAALVRRAQFERPHMILFTCARVVGLESIGKSVLTLRNAMPKPPVIAVGGAVKAHKDIVQEITGADLVTTQVKDVIAFCAQRRKAMMGE